jgi:predicted dehydrogenase
MPSPVRPSRRQFLAATAATASLTLAARGLSAAVHARPDETLEIGLVGCGGRGSGAAAQALRADPNVRLTAMGDAFADRLEGSLSSLKTGEDVVGRIDVPPERRFVGFDAYQQVIDSGVDVVLLATPPHFRPQHLKAAVDAGKHVFAEKPVAVDGPGVQSVLETCRQAKEKGLSVVSGLCLRYDKGFQEAVARIHDGELGAVRTLQANDFRGPIWVKPRQPDWSDMTWQMRNWYYFTWLGGDFNVEQHVHFLDVCAWIKGEYPVKAVGMGGRVVRNEPQFGEIYDHHSVIYEFADGAKLFSNTRQMPGCWNSMTAHVAAEKGTAEINERRLIIAAGGAEPWRYRGQHKNMYQVEHDELFASIRRGEPINNGEYMAHSTLLAIMGRMATYTGKEVTWEKALNSKQKLGPEEYGWDVEPPAPTVALPGITELV